MSSDYEPDIGSLQRAEFFAELAYVSPMERQSVLENSQYAEEFMLDSRFQNDTFSVILSKTDNVAFHAYRGTVNSSDVATDAALAFGMLHSTDRYKSNERVSSIARSYSPNHDNVIHVGHSLGGTLADQIARTRGDKSVSFNQGSTPLHNYGEGSRRNVQVRVDNDFVSSFSTGKQITVGHHHSAGILEQQMAKLTGRPLSWLGQYYQIPAAVRGISSLMSHFTFNFRNNGY